MAGKSRNGVAILLMVGLATLGAAGTTHATGGPPVKFGIVSTDSVKALFDKYQLLMEYLGKKTGRPFELVAAKDYDEIIEKMKTGELEGGVLGSGKGGKAIQQNGLVPIVRPESKGVSTYRGYVIVRKDSSFKKIEDLKGKSFDFVSKNTSAGYLFPRSLLQQKKLNPETFFSRTSFAGKHEVTLSKVLYKEVDGAAIKNLVFEKQAASDPRVNKELIVIHKSDEFPEGTIFFRKETPGAFVGTVRKAFLGMNADEAGKPVLAKVGADRYIETTAKDFAYVQKLIKVLEGK